MPNGNPVVMHLSCNFVHNVFQCRDTRGVFICAWDGLQLAYFTYYYLEGVVFIVSRLLAAACWRLQALAGDYDSSLPCRQDGGAH